MTRFLLKLILSLRITFTALSIAARALGTTPPPNPALAGFTEGCEDKPQPCWYGIVIEQTTVDEAIEILENRGWVVKKLEYETEIGFDVDLIEPPCHVMTYWLSIRTNPIVIGLDLICHNDVRTGDALASLGTPDTVGSCEMPDSATIIYRE